MPPKNRNIGRSTAQARKKKAARASETNEQREARLQTHRERNVRVRLYETSEQREARLKSDRERHARARAAEKKKQRESRLQTIRRGLAGVITITPYHTHDLMTAETLRFLPAMDCREEFEEYFNAGLGPNAASDFHIKTLKNNPDFQPSDLFNNRINPSRRTIRHWFDQWRLRHGDGFVKIESSGTAAREEEPKEHIPIEPTIEIKEEPVDYEPTPSTSTEAADEEFILPHQESNTWTPPVQLPPDPVVEPQLTLSVANLAPPNHSETPDSEQTRKRRKIKASTFVPSTNGPEASPQSPVYNFCESSNPGSSKDPRKDQFDVFGEYIAAKLRSLDRRSCAFAQRAIGDIIFEAEMGKYLNEDSDSKSLNNCAS